jgi:CBS domain-containing protein
MTIAHQLTDALGFGNGVTSRARRASRQARVAGEGLLGTVPASYLWLGFGVAAAATAALLFRDRLPGFRGHHVRDVMVHDVMTVDSSATLLEAAQRMRDGNVGVLPVVENGRLRGVITDRDLVVRAMARNMDVASTPVRYVATDELACARPDWDIEEALQVMGDCQIGRLPVVDEQDRVIGIVTLSSLALRSREQRDALHTAQEVSRRSARLS